MYSDETRRNYQRIYAVKNEINQITLLAKRTHFFSTKILVKVVGKVCFSKLESLDGLLSQ